MGTSSRQPIGLIWCSGDDSKAGGGERPLRIPTIRDRVVQTAAKIAPEAVLEADFEESAYGYRPRRSAVDAVKEVLRLLFRDHADVVDAHEVFRRSRMHLQWDATLSTGTCCGSSNRCRQGTGG